MSKIKRNTRKRLPKVTSEESIEERHFQSKPFFNKNMDREYYGENEESDEHGIEEEVHEKSKFSLSSLSLIIFAIIGVGAISYVINKALSPPDIYEEMTGIFETFKEELKRERLFLFNQSKLFEAKIFESVANHLKEKNILAEKIFKKQVENLKNEYEEIKAVLLKKQSQNQFLNETKDIKEIKESITKLEKTVFDIKSQKENLTKSSNAKNDALWFKEEIKRLNSILADVKSKATDTINGDFISRTEFYSEIKEIKNQLSNTALADSFATIRDGTEVDWANIYAGGHVTTTKNVYWKLLDFLYKRTSDIMITPIRAPGDCFAFKPRSGYTIFGLREPIRPTGFTYETIAHHSAPSHGSVPRVIRVYALVNGHLRLLTDRTTGKDFVFNSNRSRQQFWFQPFDEPISQIRFDFLENYGNEKFTCVYRIRVHGQAVA